MGKVNTQSPAILKKITGAAKIGVTSGLTVQSELDRRDFIVTNFTDLAALTVTIGQIVQVKEYASSYEAKAGSVTTITSRQINSAKGGIYFLIMDGAYVNSATGAVIRTLRNKAADISSRSDYSSNADFLADVGNKPNIDGSNNFNAKVTPSKESAQINLNAALSPVVGQKRCKSLYYTGSSVQVYVPACIVMAGFRVNGSYLKGRAPVVASGSNGPKVVAYPADLSVESAVHVSAWYAVFACSNSGDATVTYKLMPYFRVGSVAGNVATLNYAGVNSHAIAAATYTMATNALLSVDCLVITELSGGDNRFSGRTTTITANTATTVTLASIGTVGAYDYLLCAPAGFTEYTYLSSFYVDASGNVLNIADSTDIVYSANTYIQDPAFVASGAIASPGVQMHCGGYISPLATGIIIQDNESISSASTGTLYTNFSHDSSTHLIGQSGIAKEAAATPLGYVGYLTLPFSIGQSFYYWTGGTLQASRASGQLVVAGWIEP